MLQLWLPLLAVVFIPFILALEEVPHASGLKKSVRKTTPAPPPENPHIRRAPIVPAQGLSLLPHAHRMSTGVRRAPNGAAALPKVAPRPAVRLVRPGPPPPAYMMVPVPILQLPMPQMMNLAPAQSPVASSAAPQSAQPVPTLSPLALPTLPTLPPFTFPQLPQLPAHTLPPAPGGPITLAPMPTMPGLTMPPSFQRLLGMTTTTAPEIAERREYRREEKEYTDERAIKKKKGLSSVASRLPKYVDNDEDLVAPEKNAEWIVPFKL